MWGVGEECKIFSAKSKPPAWYQSEKVSPSFGVADAERDDNRDRAEGRFFVMCPTLQPRSGTAVLFLHWTRGRKKTNVCPFFPLQPNRVTWRRTTPLKTTVRPSHPLVGAREVEVGSVRVLLNQQYYRAGYRRHVPLFDYHTDILFNRNLVILPSISWLYCVCVTYDLVNKVFLHRPC